MRGDQFLPHHWRGKPSERRAESSADAAERDVADEVSRQPALSQPGTPRIAAVGSPQLCQPPHAASAGAPHRPVEPGAVNSRNCRGAIVLQQHQYVIVAVGATGYDRRGI